MITGSSIIACLAILAELVIVYGSECQVSHWSQWGECLGGCTFAMRVRNRVVTKPAFPEQGVADGSLLLQPCPPLYQIQQCTPNRCSKRTDDKTEWVFRGGEFPKEQEARSRPINGDSPEPKNEILQLANAKLKRGTGNSESSPGNSESSPGNSESSPGTSESLAPGNEAGALGVERQILSLTNHTVLAQTPVRPLTVFANEMQVHKIFKQLLESSRDADEAAPAVVSTATTTTAYAQASGSVEYDLVEYYSDDESPGSAPANTTVIPSNANTPTGDHTSETASTPIAPFRFSKLPRQRQWILFKKLDAYTSPAVTVDAGATTPPVSPPPVKENGTVTRRHAKRRRTTSAPTKPTTTAPPSTTTTTQPTTQIITSGIQVQPVIPSPNGSLAFINESSEYEYVEYDVDTNLENATVGSNIADTTVKLNEGTSIYPSTETSSSIFPINSTVHPQFSLSTTASPGTTTFLDAQGTVVSTHVAPIQDQIGTDATVPLPRTQQVITITQTTFPTTNFELTPPPPPEIDAVGTDATFIFPNTTNQISGRAITIPVNSVTLPDNGLEPPIDEENAPVIVNNAIAPAIANSMTITTTAGITTVTTIAGATVATIAGRSTITVADTSATTVADRSTATRVADTSAATRVAHTSAAPTFANSTTTTTTADITTVTTVASAIATIADRSTATTVADSSSVSTGAISPTVSTIADSGATASTFGNAVNAAAVFAASHEEVASAPAVSDSIASVPTVGERPSVTVTSSTASTESGTVPGNSVTVTTGAASSTVSTISNSPAIAVNIVTSAIPTPSAALPTNRDASSTPSPTAGGISNTVEPIPATYEYPTEAQQDFTAAPIAGLAATGQPGSLFRLTEDEKVEFAKRRRPANRPKPAAQPGGGRGLPEGAFLSPPQLVNARRTPVDVLSGNEALLNAGQNFEALGEVGQQVSGRQGESESQPGQVQSQGHQNEAQGPQDGTLDQESRAKVGAVESQGQKVTEAPSTDTQGIATGEPGGQWYRRALQASQLSSAVVATNEEQFHAAAPVQASNDPMRRNGKGENSVPRKGTRPVSSGDKITSRGPLGRASPTAKQAEPMPPLAQFPSEQGRPENQRRPASTERPPATGEPISRFRQRFNISVQTNGFGFHNRFQVLPVIRPPALESVPVQLTNVGPIKSRRLPDQQSRQQADKQSRRSILSPTTSRPSSTPNMQALLDNVHKPCGDTFGNRRCCKLPPRSRCPDGRLSQLAFRWYRLAGTDHCVAYNYGYCGIEMEQLEKPIKFQEECYELCYTDEEKKSSQIFGELRFKNGVRVAGPGT